MELMKTLTYRETRDALMAEYGETVSVSTLAGWYYSDSRFNPNTGVQVKEAKR